RLAQVVAVLLAHLRIGMHRVAVAVQGGERDADRAEQPQVLIARRGAGADLLDRQVNGRKEAAAVDLRAVEPEVAEDLERLLDGLVVQAGGVGTELHWVSPSVDGRLDYLPCATSWRAAYRSGRAASRIPTGRPD